MFKKLIFLLIPIMFSCDETPPPEIETNAVPVYNQAYNENYDSDHIDDIIAVAKNAYIIIDPFQDGVPNSIPALKANGNEVAAYISVGTGEDWRDDFDDLLPYLVSLEWDEWEGEFFIKTTTTGVLDVMKARIDKIAAWGCDWVEFDNMDWVDDEYTEIYGFEVTEEESIAYFQALCDYVHEKGMKCMSKNRTDDAYGFDGVTFESYVDEKDWWDEEGLQDFLDEGKLVIVTHYNETNCGKVYSEYKGLYNDDLSFICEDVNREGFVHFNQ